MASPRCRIAASALLLAASALPLASCRGDTPERPNVLLIVVDTLRADHLGCYGDPRETSPAADALAGAGFRFERAHSTAPWTMPSVASILTGLYPGSHGVQRFSRLPSEATTLAEILARHGYATGGVVSHVVLSSDFDFQQGFERYENRAAARPHYDVSTERVTTAAETLLQMYAQGDRPFFLFLHYFDPHYNYLRHEEIGFAPPRAGRLDGTEEIHDLRALADDMTPEELAFIGDLYDEEIRHTDDGIRRLLDRLVELGLDEETWIVFTADHGEEFLDHGWLGHTRTLYEELVRVPLLIRPPGGTDAPRAIDRLTSLVSLAPTILDLAGVDPSAYGFQARSLAPLLHGEGDDQPDAVFAEVDFIPLKADNVAKRTYKKAVITDRWKLVRDEQSGRIEIYDLTEDPGELHDLALANPEIVAGMLPVLERASALSRGEQMQGGEVSMSEERLEQLRALGYVDD